MIPDRLINSLGSFFREHGLQSSAILVAVSGGSDSVALLHLLHQAQALLKIKRLGIAHINHGLRGSESDLDEDLVRNLAGKNDAEFHSIKLTGKSLHDSGIEAWARSERYRFFHDIMKKHGYDYAATGHTADDQAETLLLRISRGTGLKGLAGIHAIRSDGIIRPLLDFRRNEIRDWLAQEGIPYRDDSSNADTSFSRNRIRHEILPVLEKEYPDAVSNMANLAQMAQKAWNSMEPAINKWMETYVLSNDIDRLVINPEGFIGLNESEEAFAECLRRKEIQFTRYHLHQISLLAKQSESKTVLFPDDWKCVITQESIKLIKNGDTEDGIAINDIRYHLHVPGITACGDKAQIRIEPVDSSVNIDPVSTDNKSVYVSLQTGMTEFEFRVLESDESFIPYGRQSEVNTGDFLKKQGLSATERAKKKAVCLKNGEIVWIPGVRISGRFAVAESSVNIYKMTYEEDR
jgi:tRNA(Ile)-lysidine synthase